MRTLSSNERARLSLADLKEAGLRAAPQGRMKVPDPVLELIETVTAESLVGMGDDPTAEVAPADANDVRIYRDLIARREFAVPDRRATSTTRGSAQRAFAEAVKRNYGYRCAITGISTRDFLVASHIVPWADDESIRLDPANGICLSTLADRAFDTGFLTIAPDATVHVTRNRLGQDSALAELLLPLDGRKLRPPAICPPNPEFLRRRNGGSTGFAARGSRRR